jgi:hypothetical protein
VGVTLVPGIFCLTVHHFQHGVRAITKPDKLLEELSADRQQEAKSHLKSKFDWAGALKDLWGRYTLVESQHQIARGRISGE